MPNCCIDFDDLSINAVKFTTYRLSGARGSGICWVSDRVSKLTHHKLLAKNQGEWNLDSPASEHYEAISRIFIYGKVLVRSIQNKWMINHYIEQE